MLFPATQSLGRSRSLERRRCASLFAVAAWILNWFALVNPAYGEATREYPLKAAFLFKLTRYVQWPPSPKPFTIGILGDDPFGEVLDQIVRGEAVQKRPVILKRSHDTGDLTACDVVFVSRSEKDRLRDVLPELSKSKILTVGETEGFCRNGGIVNLIVENGRLSFEINSLAAKRRGIVIDPQVLSLARIVDSEP
jgi:hypothetical protein